MYSLDDPELNSKKKKMIEALDQMSQMAQDKIGARPENPVVGQEVQPPLSKVAGDIDTFKGKVPPSQAQPPVPPPEQTPTAPPPQPQKRSAGDTLKSILSYALPMAFSASRGMGVVPGALAGFSAQNKADVTSNQQALEKIKEENAAELNRSRSSEEAFRNRILATKEENDAKIREMLAGTEARKVDQAGQIIPADIELKKAQAQKDLKEGLLESVVHSVFGSKKPKQAKAPSDEVAPHLPGETYAEYKKRVG